MDGIFAQEAGSQAPALDPTTMPSNVKLFLEIEQQPASSATAIQKLIQSGGPTMDLIDPAVKAVIEKLSLYQEVSEDLAKLQRSLFEESWTGFLRDLKSACPSTLGDKDCTSLASSWETVAIVNQDQINRTDRKALPPILWFIKERNPRTVGRRIYRHGPKIIAGICELRETQTRRGGYEL